VAQRIAEKKDQESGRIKARYRLGNRGKMEDSCGLSLDIDEFQGSLRDMAL